MNSDKSQLTPEAVLRTYQRAKERRSTWEQHWSECYDFALPLRTQKYQNGAKTADKLFDGTAPDAVEQLAASLLSELTPPWARWFGLVAGNLAESGLSALGGYAEILTVLLGSMLIMALLVNPLIVWIKTRRNPYPIVLTALRESGVTAFFTRSSAANIPINLALCERLDLEEDTYAVSIPLGATINTGGAAITITVLTLAATHTLGIVVDLPTALLLSGCGSVQVSPLSVLQATKTS